MLRLEKLEKCICEICEWMAKNFLCLNADKTELIIFGSKSVTEKIGKISIKVGDQIIKSSDCVRNLGAMMDSNLSMKNHVNIICRGAWYHLRRIGQIRQYLDDDTAEKLIHAYVSSKLDFMNGLIYGLPNILLDKLKRVQYAAARIARRVPKHTHMTPVLRDLHWLPVACRIEYKLLLIVFKALHGQAPKYLCDLLVQQTNSRSLRSSSQCLLVVPKTQTVTYGDRSLTYAAAKLWNILPLHIKMSPSLSCFKTSIKTCFFSKELRLSHLYALNLAFT